MNLLFIFLAIDLPEKLECAANFSPYHVTPHVYFHVSFSLGK